MPDNPPAPSPIWREPEFARGARDMTRHFALGIAAWALLTGVAMAKSGLALPLAILMSLIVFAGSAQLAALPLAGWRRAAVGDLGHRACASTCAS
jgi:predicted branched-subunit amino acid permease